MLRAISTSRTAGATPVSSETASSSVSILSIPLEQILTCGACPVRRPRDLGGRRQRNKAGHGEGEAVDGNKPHGALPTQSPQTPLSPLLHIFRFAPKAAVTRLTGRKIFSPWRLGLPAAALPAAALLLSVGRPAIAACAAAKAPVERLLCAEPSLSALDAAMAEALADAAKGATSQARREARLAEQRRWLDQREAACPAAAGLRPDAAPEDAARQVAVACLSRIYEHRVAVLGWERNAAAWPQLRFRPSIVEGAGTALCEDLERDLVAGFLGPGAVVDPLGEREIGFAPIAGLGEAPMVLRADIDAYNQDKPFPVLLWLDEDGGPGPGTAEYRAFASPAALLSAIGRGGRPLAQSVRMAAEPVIDLAKLPRPDPRKPPAGPRAAFADEARASADEMPRFFRQDGHVYLLAPMKPAPGKPGDLGVYQLLGPAQLHRACVFDAHVPFARAADPALALPEMEALKRAVGPLLPTGRLCSAAGEAARALADHAAYRPWVLDRDPPGRVGAGRVALYLRNRALTGPEAARRYRAYAAARDAAVRALAPFYIREFGRAAGDAQRLASLYVDRVVADGFELDPDDEAATALLAPDYAQRRDLQQKALAGDTAALVAALGPEPRAIAKGVEGDLDEPLVTDALEHPQTLRALLGLGLDPNRAGASGRTPLMAAARLDLTEAAAILLAHGAAPDAGAGDAVAQTDRTGDPLCMRGDAAAGEAPGRTALSYAVERASPEMVRLLLAQGAAAAKPDSAGRRPSDYLKDRGGDPAQAAAIAALLR